MPGGRLSAHLAVLHGRLADPVDPRVVPDGLVHRVGSYPVGVQYPQGADLTAHPLLRDAAQVPSGLLLLDTLVVWLPVDDALGHLLLASSTLDPDPIDEIALLRLVAELPGLIRPGRPGAPVDRWELPKLPGAHPGEEAHRVRLLLPPQLLEVLVCTHPGEERE